MAFSPNGHWLATVGWDRTGRIWEVDTGLEVRILLGHSDAVSTVRFSPDGRWLATGSEDKTVRLWETRAWRLQYTLPAHEDAVRVLGFSPDGRWLATGSRDKTVVVWDVVTGRQFRRLEPLDYQVTSLAFSPRGDLLAAATGSYRIVKLWDTRTWSLAQTLESKTQSAGEFVFAPDGQWLVSTATGGTTLWELSTGQASDILKSYRWFEAPTLSPDGRLLAVKAVPLREGRVRSLSDGRITIWETGTWREVRTLVGDSPLAFSPDGRLLAGRGAAGVTLWNLGTGQPLRTLP